MKIIPVIDLKNGLAVHAKQGNRESYQAINSPLSASADAFQLLNAFLKLYPFDTFYIADLDALMGNNHQSNLIDQIASHYPDKLFWVDNGYQTEQFLWVKPKNWVSVLGSESLTNHNLIKLKNWHKKFILSLDFSAQGKLGATQLFTEADYWPEKVIIMSLAQVGSHQGADFATLKTYCQQYPHQQFIAAGGVRHHTDLFNLQQLGIQSVLVASALHSGKINPNNFL